MRRFLRRCNSGRRCLFFRRSRRLLDRGGFLRPQSSPPQKRLLAGEGCGALLGAGLGSRRPTGPHRADGRADAAERRAGESADGRSLKQLLHRELGVGVLGILVNDQVCQVGSRLFRRFHTRLLGYVLQEGRAARTLHDVKQFPNGELFGNRFDAAGDQAPGKGFAGVHALLVQFSGFGACRLCAHQPQPQRWADARNKAEGDARRGLAHREDGVCQQLVRAGKPPGGLRCRLLAFPQQGLSGEVWVYRCPLRLSPLLCPLRCRQTVSKLLDRPPCRVSFPLLCKGQLGPQRVRLVGVGVNDTAPPVPVVVAKELPPRLADGEQGTGNALADGHRPGFEPLCILLRVKVLDGPSVSVRVAGPTGKQPLGGSDFLHPLLGLFHPVLVSGLLGVVIVHPGLVHLALSFVGQLIQLHPFGPAHVRADVLAAVSAAGVAGVASCAFRFLVGAFHALGVAHCAGNVPGHLRLPDLLLSGLVQLGAVVLGELLLGLLLLGLEPLGRLLLLALLHRLMVSLDKAACLCRLYLLLQRVPGGNVRFQRFQGAVGKGRALLRRSTLHAERAAGRSRGFLGRRLGGRGFRRCLGRRALCVCGVLGGCHQGGSFQGCGFVGCDFLLDRLGRRLLCRLLGFSSPLCRFPPLLRFLVAHSRRHQGTPLLKDRQQSSGSPPARFSACCLPDPGRTQAQDTR